eukprot:834267-Lingulodinium_polyedra.AAC.1
MGEAEPAAVEASVSVRLQANFPEWAALVPDEVSGTDQLSVAHRGCCCQGGCRGFQETHWDVAAC